MHGSFGQNFVGGVTGCPSIAEKTPRLITERVPADRNPPFRITTDPACIDEVTKGLVTVQNRQMFLPFSRFADDIACQFGAGPADPGVRVLVKRAQVIG